MSLISYNGLMELIHKGYIKNAPYRHVNPASIDVTLDDVIKVEQPLINQPPIDLYNGGKLKMREVEIPEEGFIFEPGAFILASTVEMFNLPEHIACEFKLKSSLARSGLNHMLAGWGDPGWHSSKMTLEIYNQCRFHSLLLRPGMKIGQIVFWECEPVPVEHSYAVKGRYNCQAGATESKGLK